MSKKKLLFISHNASKSGAPILLLRLIEEIQKTERYTIEILLLRDGPLRKNFEVIAPTHVPSFQFAHRWIVRRVIKYKFFYKYTGEYTYRLDMKKKVEEADIIFANTIVPISFLQKYHLQHPQVFFYVHELLFAIKASITDEQMRLIGTVSKKIFVPANFVRNFLVKTYNFEQDKISILKYVVPSFVDGIKTERTTPTFVAGVCASLNLRKGFDLFGLIVQEIVCKRKITGISFTWVGVDDENHEALLTLETDLVKLGIDSYVTLVRSTDQAIDYIRRFDVLLLTSREDPYPLVVTEAASQGVPTIYFEGAGGIGEFVGDGGLAVPYLDLEAYADAILRLKEDRALLHRLSNNALKNFQEEKQGFNVNQLILDIEE